MADIYHQIGVNTNTHQVYNAITTLGGLSGWWTNTTGSTEINGNLYFHFNDVKIEMTILELVPDKKVVWQCTEKEGEWKDTIITYDLVKTDEQVFVNFSHTKWLQQTSFCSHCNTKWAVFLLSLKDYLEKGKGQPFPDDIQINHIDF
jgi:uncharacterized protein YndB with AHSA1/START domain